MGFGSNSQQQLGNPLDLGFVAGYDPLSSFTNFLKDSLLEVFLDCKLPLQCIDKDVA